MAIAREARRTLSTRALLVIVAPLTVSISTPAIKGASGDLPTRESINPLFFTLIKKEAVSRCSITITPLMIPRGSMAVKTLILPP